MYKLLPQKKKKKMTNLDHNQLRNKNATETISMIYLHKHFHGFLHFLIISSTRRCPSSPESTVPFAFIIFPPFEYGFGLHRY